MIQPHLPICLQGQDVFLNASSMATLRFEPVRHIFCPDSGCNILNKFFHPCTVGSFNVEKCVILKKANSCCNSMFSSMFPNNSSLLVSNLYSLRGLLPSSFPTGIAAISRFTAPIVASNILLGNDVFFGCSIMLEVETDILCSHVGSHTQKPLVIYDFRVK